MEFVSSSNVSKVATWVPCESPRLPLFITGDVSGEVKGWAVQEDSSLKLSFTCQTQLSLGVVGIAAVPGTSLVACTSMDSFYIPL